MYILIKHFHKFIYLPNKITLNMESNLFNLSKEYEENHYIKKLKNSEPCSLGIGCKKELKNILLYLFIGIIFIICTASLIINISYSVDKSREKSIIDDDFEYIDNTSIKYNDYGNIFVSNIIYQ